MPEVADEPELREIVSRHVALIVMEAIAAIKLMDVETARRARDNLIVLMVGAPSPRDLEILSTLLSAVQAVVESDKPCKALRLAERALSRVSLVGEAVGKEAVEAIETLHKTLKEECRGSGHRGQA